MKTYGDIYNEFCDKFPNVEVEDYRPADPMYIPKEAEEEARRMQEELNEIFRKQAKEQKERAEYERLKAKYENL